MNPLIGLITLVVTLSAATGALACTPNQPGKLQMGRTITIDTEGGAAHGSVSYGETGLLRDKEVLLTFDDGPVVGRTTAVLEALEHHCVTATFFPVGRMAMARPNILRDTLRRGHTIGGHTWSHPNLRRSSIARSRSEIQKGFAALQAVIGPRVAPVFRFPYLAESKRTLAYVKSNDIASISIDVDSGDTRGYGVKRVITSTMASLRRRGRGVLLFHDSKLVTVRALPKILELLAKEGFRVVHLKTKALYGADPKLVARYRRQLARSSVDRIIPPPPERREQAKTSERLEAAGSIGPLQKKHTTHQPADRTNINWHRNVFDAE
ncbi:MAG: polysaccharide deacetylase family protein [Pseudomonadota bacterium]